MYRNIFGVTRVLLAALLLLLTVGQFASSFRTESRHISTLVTSQQALRLVHHEKPFRTRSLIGRLRNTELASTSLIPESDSWGNWAVLAASAALAQEWGTSTRIGRLLGPPVSAMAITFVLASIGVLHPGGTVAAKSMQLLALQLATPLVLLGADLRDCVKRCGPMLTAFLWAAMSTVVACSVGWILCGGMLSDALGKRDALIIAAALMAKNIGGGLNYVAVCRTLSASPQAFAAGLCVDNIFGLIYFPASSALSAGRPDVKEEDVNLESTTTEDSPVIDIKQTTAALCLATVLTYLGERFGGESGALPLCTLLTVLVASLAPRRWIQPLQPAAHVLGTVALYMFFSTAGAPGLAVADSVRQALIPLSLFNVLLYGIHGALLWFGYVFWGKKDDEGQKTSTVSAAFVPQRLLVGSSASIGGPATAAALAEAQNWKSLVVPSLLVGNLGYAIATFLALVYHGIFS